MSSASTSSWPSGIRDTTEWPNVQVSVSVEFREHLDNFIKLDGVEWADYDEMDRVSGGKMTPQRWRSYRVMYERMGLITKVNDRIALTPLGKAMRDLPKRFEERGQAAERELARGAARVLVRYQFDNPIDGFAGQMSPGSDVRPFRALWIAALELENKLHFQELNRVFLKVQRMDELPAAIGRVRDARKAVGGSYSGVNESRLVELLGDQVNDDQASARMAAWFSAAGWGGLLFAKDVETDGFRHLTDIGEELLPAVLKEPLTYFHGSSVEDWNAYYFAPFASGGSGSNVIFYGPPGTGKSKRADDKALSLGSNKFRTLFHPEFTYADFVGSYRPVVGRDSSSQIVDRNLQVVDRPVSYFEYVPGVLAEALKASFANPNAHVVLLIDEINRGDCAAIFGDFFQLLDRDEHGLSKYGVNADPELLKFLGAFDIRGDGKLYFPGNFSLFATMNTSDQSLYGMDAAFKRRWDWEPCHVEYDELTDFFKVDLKLVGDISGDAFDWIKLLRAINAGICRRGMEDKQIGPWFLMPDKSGQVFMREFSNKCLFYLWHDVFKDDHATSESPFRDDGSIHTFAHLQKVLDERGIRQVLKEEVVRAFAPPAVHRGTADADAPASLPAEVSE